MQTSVRFNPSQYPLFIIFHSFAILYIFSISSITYWREKRYFQAFVPTICRINQTDTFNYPCTNNDMTQSTRICQNTFFGIIYDNHRFLYTNHTLHWSQTSNNMNNINRTHFDCYYHRAEPHLVLIAIPGWDKFKSLIGLSVFGLYICVVNIIDSTVLSRRW